jgi:nitrate reductase NapE component
LEKRFFDQTESFQTKNVVLKASRVENKSGFSTFLLAVEMFIILQAYTGGVVVWKFQMLSDHIP